MYGSLRNYSSMAASVCTVADRQRRLLLRASPRAAQEANGVFHGGPGQRISPPALVPAGYLAKEAAQNSAIGGLPGLDLVR
jgi:hypothetical protein